MAKMIGKIGEQSFSCGCCDWSRGKRAVKADEDRLWQKEATEEISDFPHENNLCSDPKTGMVGCEVCYPDDHLWNADPKDLEGIEGVTLKTERLD